MQKSACINTRVEPFLKEQAENVLNQLGMSMATAMTLFLKQIVIRRGIPFDICLPEKKLLVYDALSEEAFNQLIDRAEKSYAAGKCVPFEEFEKQLSEEIGL